MQITNLIELIQVKKELKKKGITFITGGGQEEFLSYAALYDKARTSLAVLQLDLKQGDEVVFQIDDNKTFVILFWACILGGFIPVPVTRAVKEDQRQKLFNIWKTLHNPFLVSSSKWLKEWQSFAKKQKAHKVFQSMQHRFIEVDRLDEGDQFGQLAAVQPDDIAFLQFSSGSTGMPKGVILTHQNLLTNVADISKASKYSAQDSMISWMPLTHDMGLIGFHLNPLFVGMNQFLMPAQLFVRRPALWLNKVTEHKVTILSSPNFGYHYVLRHTNAKHRQTWDLSSVRVLYNGAEPISDTLCRQFLSKLAASGLKASAMMPVYGLAEASLAVTMSDLDTEIMPLYINRNSVKLGQAITESEQREKDTLCFLNVGKVIQHCSLRIVDSKGGLVEDGIIGHVQIKGQNVTQGYYNNPEATAATFKKGGWLDTGDLGFLKAGDLYITGRAKELIVIGGQNFYPQDVEEHAATVEGVEMNKVVFVGSMEPDSQQEEVIGFVLFRGKLELFPTLAKEIKTTIRSRIGLEVKKIIPVKDIPRTTSGKLQRFKLLQKYKAGAYEEVQQQIHTYTNAATCENANQNGESQNVPDRLLNLWRQIFNRRDIHLNSNFHDIGGTSLLAAQLSMKLWEEWGLELPLSVLYDNPTIADLAEIINKLETKAYNPISVIEEQEHYPISMAQKRLFYAWEMTPSSVAYNLPAAFQIKGEIQPDKLESCLQQLLTKHEALRLYFLKHEGDVRFAIADKVDFRLECETVVQADIQTYLKGLVLPFNLLHAPLFRAKLLALENGEHLLFLDCHHTVLDGVSMALLMEELMYLYCHAKLPEITIQYKDFSIWEKTWLQEEKIATQGKYWKGKLSGNLSELDLPLDYPRPAMLDTNGRLASFILSPRLTKSLRQLARKNNCTLHVLLFTIYKILLFKYTGNRNIVIGIPVANRRHPDLQRVLGMFVNNLVIQHELPEDSSFLEVLERESQNMALALENQDYPFAQLLAQLEEVAKVDRNPVFDTMFVFQDMHVSVPVGCPLSMDRVQFDPGFSKFDLSLEIVDQPDQLLCSFEYATKLFKPERIQQLIGYFKELVNQILQAPEQKIQHLSILTDEAFDELVYRYNDTKAPVFPATSLIQLFEQQVAAQPDRVAIHYQGKDITFQQLDQQTNRLANYLQKEGLGNNQLVGIWLERSPLLISSILGVLKAGGCFLPIDQSTPVRRLQLWLEDSDCQWLLSQSDLWNPAVEVIGLAKASQYQTALLDLFDWEAFSDTFDAAIYRPNDLAYVIYTSGTTGRPKGVMISQSALVNYIAFAADQYWVGPDTCFPLFTSISFDLTITSLFTPLLNGGKVVIYAETENKLLIQKILQEDQVDVIKLTPSHLRLLLEGDWPLAENARLSKLVVGGEAFESKLARQVHAKCKGRVTIYNEYGPTEATVGCMIHQYEPNDPTFSSVPIGTPAPNMQIYLLDTYLNPVPAGVKGEIYISGTGLADGYLNRPALTEEKFIDHPFIAGEKMYRTGDAAIRGWEDDSLIYLGRLDQQVKINGFRVELSEIKHCLEQLEGISDAVVTYSGDPGQHLLRAYYKHRPTINLGLTPDQIRDALAKQLPYYMLPAQFIQIDEIPLTQNGKLDVAALPKPIRTNDHEYHTPKNTTEGIMLETWKEIFATNNIYTTDNFFELGGDSIKAVQITSRLRKKGIVLSVKDIITYRSISQISPHVQRSESSYAYDQDLVSGTRACTPIENWFLDQNFANPAYFNQSVLLRFSRPLDVAIVRKAFRKLIEHHDGLRSNLRPDKREIFLNDQHLAQELEVLHVPIDEMETFLQTETAFLENFRAGFNLAKDLLIKAAHLQTTSGESYLFITAHHLLVDGVSWRILLEDFYLLYGALEKEKSVELPPKTASVLDWEKALQRQVATIGVKEQGYWGEIVKTRFSLPVDKNKVAPQPGSIARVRGKLDKQRTAYLVKEAHRAYCTDVPILLTTAWARTIKQWTGQSHLVIEQENHGRHLDEVDTSRTIGWFTALYPVLIDLPEGPLPDQIKAVKEQLRAIPGRGLEFGLLKYLSHLAEDSPLEPVPIRFNYLGQFDQAFNNDLFEYIYASTGSEIASSNHLSAQLEINMLIVKGELLLEILYDAQTYKTSTIAWLIQQYINELHVILDHVETVEETFFTPSDFPTARLSEAELNSLFA